MQIEFVKKYRQYKPGDVIDLPPKSAKIFTVQGLAIPFLEKVQAKVIDSAPIQKSEKSLKSSNNPPKPKSSRNKSN